MTHEEAIDKVVRLLKLARSDNPNEAALAASRAQEIIDRYKLGTLGLSAEGEAPKPDEPIARFDGAPLSDGNGRWRHYLSYHVSRANQCRTFIRNKHVMLVGRPSDAETVRYIYTWLEKEVGRLTDRDGQGMGKTWRNNFRLGVVETISNRLADERKTLEATMANEVSARKAIPQENAIVLVQDALVKLEQKGKDVDVWIKANMKLKPASSSQINYNHEARNAGRKSGHEIAIKKKTAGALGSGQ